MSNLEQMVEAINTPQQEASTTAEISESPPTVVEPSSSNVVEQVNVTPDDIWERIGAVSPEEIIKWLKGLIFGDPGAGKTYFGGSAGMSELTAPLLLIDVDGGYMSVRDFPGIKVRQVRSVQEMHDLHAEVHKWIDWSDPKDPKLPFKTAMIDSLTELQKIDMVEIMKITKAVLEGRQDPFVPSEREWFISQGHMRQVVRKWKDLPCHLLVTAHLDPKKNSKNQMVNGPDLPGKLRNQISGFFDVVGYLTAQQNGAEVNRIIQFAKTDTTIAKDRLKVLGQVMVNPTFPMLVEKLEHQGESK